MTAIPTETIETELKEYIQALTAPGTEIKPESSLQEMNIDSISLVKIFVFIEKKFNVSLINSKITRENIKDFGNMVALIVARQ